MTVAALFKKETYTTTEMNVIAEALTNPSVQKYLNDQLIQAFAALAEAEQGDNEPDGIFLRKQEKLKGCIATFKQLLRIEKAPVIQS